jgi:hypothetical protein
MDVVLTTLVESERQYTRSGGSKYIVAVPPISPLPVYGARKQALSCARAHHPERDPSLHPITTATFLAYISRPPLSW